MPTHSMTCAHPCPPMLFKLRPYIQKLCNVYYPQTPSLGWIGQIKGRSLSLASARSTSWLAYSLHPRSLTLIWSWMHDAQNRCPLMNNNITPMPTQNPWLWAPNVGLRSLPIYMMCIILAKSFSMIWFTLKPECNSSCIHFLVSANTWAKKFDRDLNLYAPCTMIHVLLKCTCPPYKIQLYELQV
jgi:hypothetical protein